MGEHDPTQIMTAQAAMPNLLPLNVQIENIVMRHRRSVTLRLEYKQRLWIAAMGSHMQGSTVGPQDALEQLRKSLDLAALRNEDTREIPTDETELEQDRGVSAPVALLLALIFTAVGYAISQLIGMCS